MTQELELKLKFQISNAMNGLKKEGESKSELKQKLDQL